MEHGAWTWTWSMEHGAWTWTWSGQVEWCKCRGRFLTSFTPVCSAPSASVAFTAVAFTVFAASTSLATLTAFDFFFRARFSAAVARFSAAVAAIAALFSSSALAVAAAAAAAVVGAAAAAAVGAVGAVGAALAGVAPSSVGVGAAPSVALVSPQNTRQASARACGFIMPAFSRHCAVAWSTTSRMVLSVPKLNSLRSSSAMAGSVCRASVKDPSATATCEWCVGVVSIVMMVLAVHRCTAQVHRCTSAQSQLHSSCTWTWTCTCA